MQKHLKLALSVITIASMLLLTGCKSIQPLVLKYLGPQGSSLSSSSAKNETGDIEEGVSNLAKLTKHSPIDLLGAFVYCMQHNVDMEQSSDNFSHIYGRLMANGATKDKAFKAAQILSTFMDGASGLSGDKPSSDDNSVVQKQ